MSVVHQPWYRNLFPRRPAHPSATTETRADAGDADAQFSLGQQFDEGQGDAVNNHTAIEWYRKAANQNHARAQFTLGMIYADGRGVARDDVQAMRWILRAAELGFAGAQHTLGVRHRRASFTGLPDNAVESNLEAYKWFHLAAAQGYKGSDAELENITLRLTREQVLEGDQRASRWSDAHASACQPAGALRRPDPDDI